MVLEEYIKNTLAAVRGGLEAVDGQQLDIDFEVFVRPDQGHLRVDASGSDAHSSNKINFKVIVDVGPKG